MRIKAFLFILFLFAGAFAQAGNFQFTKAVKKSAIVESTTIALLDITDPVKPTGGVNKYSAEVSLIYGREGLSDLQASKWYYSVDIMVKFLDNAGVVKSAYTDYLEIEKNGSDAAKYQATLKFEDPTHTNYSRVQVFVTYKYDPNNAPGDIRLEATLKNDYWQWISITPTRIGVDATNKLVYWSEIAGAESYDLEWVYIDEYDKNVGSDVFAYKRGVRINTTALHYDFNFTYPKGKVYFRVRGVGYQQGTKVLAYSKWADNDPTANNATAILNITTDFEANKNWQYVTTYAEGGKNKKQISYYDETLRKRQSIVNISTDTSIIVSENKYDYEGRAVISVLPTPVKSTSLSYIPQFNTFANGKKAYDNNTESEALSTSSGVEKYYSTSNPFTNSINFALLPKSEGYGYSQVAFTRDHTGRVLRQSGVGKAFRFHSGTYEDKHFSRYTYATPSETELKKVFGSNIGVAKHYKKNTTIDENGQISVTYKDQEDRVVATVLAGNTPDNLMPLPSNTGKASLATIPTSLNQNNKVDTIGFISRSVSKIQNLSTGQTYDFKFDLNGAINKTDATFGSFCKACVYELKIKIIDPEGKTVKDITEKLEPTTITCSTQTTYSLSSSHNALDHSSLTSGLKKMVFDQIGEYTVIKDLTLSSGSIDAVVASLKKTTTFPDSAKIVAPYVANVDTNLCNISCEDQCLLKIKSKYSTWSTWTSSRLKDSVNSCAGKDCNGSLNSATETISSSSCEALLERMLSQLRPGGYYNSLSGWLEGKIASVIFTDANGAAMAVKPTAADLRNETIFREQWAMDLLKGAPHPEYCHYQNCLKDLSSDRYDMQMSFVKDWSQAISSGYINPLGVTSANGMLANTANKDPFFQSGGRGNSKLTDLSNLLKTYKKDELKDGKNLDLNGDGDIIDIYSLWEYAGLKGLYNKTPNDTEKWNTFKAIYLGEKQRIKIAVTEGVCPYLAPSEITNVPRPSLPEDTLKINSINYNNMKKVCLEGRDENVGTWMNMIKGKCNVGSWQTNGDSLMISKNLKSYYSESCGYSNPFGLLLKQASYTSYLGNVQTKLSSYGCSLNDVASDDPCVRRKSKKMTLDIVSDTTSIYFSLINEYLDSLIRSCNSPGSNCILNYNKLVKVENFKVYKKYKSIFDNGGRNQTKLLSITTIPWPPDTRNGIKGFAFKFFYEGGEFNNFIELFQLGYCRNYGISDTLVKRIINIRPDPTHYPAQISFFQFDVELLNGKIVPYQLRNHLTYNQGSFIAKYLAVKKETRTIQYCDSISSKNSTFTFDFVPKATKDSCIAAQKREAIKLGTKAWKDTATSYVTTFLAKHFNNCFKNYSEDFYYSSKAPYQYHYTLYYYDQSGNLVQTVPPEGVDSLSSFGANAAFDAKGNYKTSLKKEPQHRLGTLYKYNSLNQLIWQKSPDGGSTCFYYDDKGQLKLSQNQKQKGGKKYSYSKYDYQGRVVETGQINSLKFDSTWFNNPLKADSARLVLNSQEFPLWSDYDLSEITKTIYDVPNPMTDGTFTQENLRGRVSVSMVMPTEAKVTSKSIYSYDIHGNVKALVQEVDGMEPKRIDYEYDLLSGKVNKVSYQKGKIDQFIHAFTYDADNRIQSVKTSNDGVVWDEDAKYLYYKHGPLARAELGELKVQGEDYYYTLQGWLKGINTAGLYSGFVTRSLRFDGYYNYYGNPFMYFGRDEFALSLGYYQKDFSPIFSSVDLGASNPEGSMGYWTTLVGDNLVASGSTKGLFNGNISVMVTDIPEINRKYSTESPLMGQVFKYDQLNRIREGINGLSFSLIRLSVTTDIKWDPAKRFTNFYNSYQYDANGNITNLARYKTTKIDSIAYSYNYSSNKLINNKLTRANDITGDPKVVVDLGNQPVNNYSYDEIGNLRRDSTEEIKSIEWTIGGKVKSITRRTGSTKPDLEFLYDASGNRITKILKPRTTAGLSTEKDWTYTYYLRDASGNTMSTYELTSGNYDIYNYRTLKLKSFDIYGSKRLGEYKEDKVVRNEEIGFSGYDSEGRFNSLFVRSSSSPSLEPYNYRELNKRGFELTDHLGNVSAVVSDLKIGIDTDGDLKANHYIAKTISAFSYYPFGMQMPGRTFEGTGYRYGYGSHEKDNEIKGSGNHLSFGDYGYDTRLGRRWNIDPMASKYPGIAPYSFCFNNPIIYKDPDGQDGVLIVFPDYKVDPELKVSVWGKNFQAPKLPLGHAGVLLIDNKTGLTKYYEFGRYPTTDGTKGRVRSIPVPNVVIGKDGQPTQESLNKVLGVISQKSGHGGRIEGAYIESDNFKEMNDYAQQKMNESNVGNKEYNKDREPYDLYNNNCGTFGCDVLKQDPSVKEKAPSVFNPTPTNVVEEYQDEFIPLKYDPATKTTTIKREESKQE